MATITTTARLRFARTDITATIPMLVRPTDTTGRAISLEAYLSAPDLGTTATTVAVSIPTAAMGITAAGITATDITAVALMAADFTGKDLAMVTVGGAAADSTAATVYTGMDSQAGTVSAETDSTAVTMAGMGVAMTDGTGVEVEDMAVVASTAVAGSTEVAGMVAEVTEADAAKWLERSG